MRLLRLLWWILDMDAVLLVMEAMAIVMVDMEFMDIERGQLMLRI